MPSLQFLCKRIWVQELERVPQLHQMDAQATATSEKAGGQPGPKLWLRLSNSADGPSPLSPTLRFQVLRCSPLGLTARPRHCPVLSFSAPSWRSLMLLLPRSPGKPRDRQWQSVQPKGSDQLCPHSCREGLHQTECGEASKGCVVEEHDVEIA